MADLRVREALRESAAALMRSDFDAAHAAALRALTIDPADADALNLLGLARFRAGDTDAAVAALEAAVAVRPSYRNAWDNLLGVLDATGRREDAARCALRGLAAIQPAPTMLLCDVALRCFNAGLLAAAAECLERALAQAPNERRVLHYLAVVRDAQRRPSEARALIARVLAMPMVSVAERAAAAAIGSKATEPEALSQALVEALRVIDQDPQHVGAHDCAAIVLGKLGRREEAIAMARDNLQRAPADADAVFTLARLLEEDARLDEAAAVLAAAGARASRDARLLRLCGSVRLRRGDARAAAEDFAHALQQAPDDQAAIAQRGLALLAAGDAGGAREWLGQDRFIAALQLTLPAGFADARTFNAQLADDIRRHSRLRFEPVGLAAKGGYLTEDLLADSTPAILGFERSLRIAIDAYLARLTADPAHPFLRAIPRAGYTLNLWATRVTAQGNIDTHIHDESWLSGAYYVELPPAVTAGDDHAGWIEFGRPHRGLPPVPDTALRCVQPVVGTLLLFPSYLYHRTLPFTGAGERISISFDLAALRQ